jgi:hypothetical protein
MRTRLVAELERPVNRTTVAALLLWILYLVAERPWRYGHHGSLFEAPGHFFLAFGYHVAGALGFYPLDLGWIQFCAGAGALIVTVRVLFWAFRPRSTARP